MLTQQVQLRRGLQQIKGVGFQILLDISTCAALNETLEGDIHWGGLPEKLPEVLEISTDLLQFISGYQILIFVEINRDCHIECK